MIDKVVIIAYLLFFAGSCLAQESIETVMARMQPQVAVQIGYQETRFMGFFADDWQGSGYLYAAQPDTLLKQQVQPETEIMAATGRQLTYHKPGAHTFHQVQIDDSDPMMSSLSAFKGIMTGNLPYLRQHYHIKFISLESSWTLELTAKYHEPDVTAVKISLHGLQGQAAQEMNVLLPDGDRSHYQLSQPQQGLAIKQKITDLLQSVQGH